MPPVILGAVVAAAGTALTGAIAGTLTLSSILISGAISLITGGLSYLLAPDPPKQRAITNTDTGLTRQVRQPITERKSIYGEVRVSGPIVFIASTNNNQHLHLVIALADHEVEEIGEMFINEFSVPVSHFSGNTINTGRYADKVRVKRYLGTDSQLADVDLITEVPGWTSEHKLSGIAYVYVRLVFDRNVWPSGIPNLSFIVKGKKVFDPRSGLTRWTNNPALFARDYLIDVRRGVGVPATRIDDDQVIASANNCDEFINTKFTDIQISSVDHTTETLILSSTEVDTLQFVRGDRVTFETGGTPPNGLFIGQAYYIIPIQIKDTIKVKLASSYADSLTGTAVTFSDNGSGAMFLRKVSEPRYSAGGVVKSNADHSVNLTEILSSMSGNLIYSNGKYKITSGVYSSPTVSFDEKNIISPLTVQTRQSKRDRFNQVKGIYSSPINLGQPSDYPSYNNTTRQTEDGEVLSRELNQPFVQRSCQAQRLGKIASERMRQEILVTADFDMSALQVTVGENINLSFSRYGWVNKPFEILRWSFTSKLIQNVPTPIVQLVLKETASTIYDFNADLEEVLPDPAPNTELPNAFDVSPVEGFALFSREVLTENLDKTYVIVASWLPPTNQFVFSGGYVEILYKKSSETTYKPLGIFPANQTQVEIFQAELDVQFDVAIRMINYLGVAGPLTYILGFVVGTSGGVTATQDWRLFSESVILTDDWGLFSDSVVTTQDWGTFT